MHFYLFNFKPLQQVKILTVKIRYSVQLQNSVEDKSAISYARTLTISLIVYAVLWYLLYESSQL